MGDTEEEVPFQLVGRRRNNKPRPSPSPSTLKSKTYSNSTGTITNTNANHNGNHVHGFIYSSYSNKGRETEEERGKEKIKVAMDAIDAVVAYFSSALPSSLKVQGKGKEKEVLPAPKQEKNKEQETFAKRILSVLQSIYSPNTPTSSFNLPQKIVCLGLGSPTKSRTSRIQLGLLVFIQTYLTLLHKQNQNQEEEGEEVSTISFPCHTYAYDPIFSTLDVTILTHYNIIPFPSSSSSDESEIQTHYTAPISQPMLLYMPHCDRDLYESVLSLSSPTSLPPKHFVLLGNLLKKYLESSIPLPTSSTLAHLIPKLSIAQLPNWTSAKRKELANKQEHNEIVWNFVKVWDGIALDSLGFHWL